MELAPILIILVLLVAGFYLWPRIRLIANLTSRVRYLQKMSDSPSLKSGIEYCNAWCEKGTEIYELTLFDLNGIRDDKPIVPADELDAYMQANGWRQTVSRYNYVTVPFGVTHQHERAKN